MHLFFSEKPWYNTAMKNEIRQPQQERSIEKKNRIIQAGYELFSEIGYYGTNTVEIAKRAGVSTGIVYGYFHDKHDILLCVLEIYLNEVTEPLLELFRHIELPLDLPKLVTAVVDKTIEMHTTHAQLHNTLHSLASSDEAVDRQFLELEERITKGLTMQLAELGLAVDHLPERIHLAINLVQSFAHEYVFDNHDYIDYNAMHEIVCKTICGLIEG